MGTAGKNYRICHLPSIHYLETKKKLIFMFEQKSPEHYLLVLTFAVSESVLESSVGAVLVLDPGKASSVSCLHVE